MNSVVVFSVVLLLALSAKVHAFTPFRLTDCTTGANRLFRVSHGQLLDYPITMPGHVRASGTLHVLRDVTDNLRLDVHVERYVLYDYFTVPCVYRVGSCAYDFCGLLDWFASRGCPWQLRASNNFPCMCPVQAGNYTLRPHPFNIRNVAGAWQWIAAGDYRITGRVTDTVTNEEVSCYRVEFTTQAAYTDYSWLWNW